MSTSTGTAHPRALRQEPSTLAGLGRRARSYWASDARRAAVSALGLVWMLDGALQLQSFMYSRGFAETIRDSAAGQPLWLESSIRWGAQVVQHDLTAWNTLFALIQIAIGVGLLYRPTVKPALALSFLWALVVWWFGEAFGMLFMMMATPLSGAPGAAVLYLIVGLAVWPTPRPGGMLGVRGVRLAWAALWLAMAWLWLAPQGSSPGSIADALRAAPSGAGWLTSAQHWAATATQGHGVAIALTLAALSAVIAVAVALNWHARPFLILAVALNGAYWVFGQGLGGIFTGTATDPNAAPLFVLLAFVLYALTPYTDGVPLAQPDPSGELASGANPCR